MAMTRFERYFKGLEDQELSEALKAGHRALADRVGQTDEEIEAKSEIVSIGQYTEAAQDLVNNWGKMQGLTSGYRCIDELTKGFVGGELVILGGYTHRGKTQLAINMADRIAKEGVAVLFITLEMTKPILTSRFMKLGQVDQETAVFMQSEDVVEPRDVEPMIVKAKGSGCGFVIIDHLHYFARGDNMLGKVGEVTRDFKRLAIKYDIPILLLSQLSRAEKSHKKGKLAIPSLSGLKESGYIEQDADVVLMVHRDMPEDYPEFEGGDYSEVLVAQRKNRNRGMTGSQVVRLRHVEENGVRLIERMQ